MDVNNFLIYILYQSNLYNVKLENGSVCGKLMHEHKWKAYEYKVQLQELYNNINFPPNC